MMFSTKGRYGLRALLDLAINSNGSHVPLQVIAERQNISLGYLEQVFSTLRKARLVTSLKGSQGGYILNDTTSNIKIGRILRILEGNLNVVESNVKEENDIEFCIKENLWDKLDDAILNIVENITLEDLIEKYKAMNSSNNFMFYI